MGHMSIQYVTCPFIFDFLTASLLADCWSGGSPLVKEGCLTVVQAVDWGMEPVFWPVSLDQCAACPWLLRTELNSSTEPRALNTHSPRKYTHTNTHMLALGIVRYVSTERMCQLTFPLCSAPHPPIIPLLFFPSFPLTVRNFAHAHYSPV